MYGCLFDNKIIIIIIYQIYGHESLFIWTMDILILKLFDHDSSHYGIRPFLKTEDIFIRYMTMNFVYLDRGQIYGHKLRLPG